ncbi:unnamed protein product [Gongylonema pulchrum]|uniref:PGM_PMM_IV domain-containing protein n=1 Tax=Gongylonema pulchrum TaxID=637853 RepID=A0A183DAD0_9BILA|nr:unnamed protein product [Gongylonema pulchrum]
MGISSIKGILSLYDNVYELNPDPATKEKCELEPCFGKLDPEKFAGALTKKNLEFSREDIDGKTLFTLKTLGATVRLEKGGLRTVMNCTNPENRRLLAEAITVCLKKL